MNRKRWWVIFISLFAAALRSQAVAGEPLSRELAYRVSFHYGDHPELPREKKQVLLVDETIENTSKTRSYHLSFWNQEPLVLSMAPKGAFVLGEVDRDQRKPAPPGVRDMVTLAPGQKYESSRWYWASTQFPYQSADQRSFFTVPRTDTLTVIICRNFKNHAREFKSQLDKEIGEFDVGRVCSAPTTFTYNVLMKM